MTKLKPDLAKKLLPTKLGNSDNIEIDHYDRLRHSVMIIADKQRLDPIRDQIELLEIINNIVNQEISNNAIAGANTIIDLKQQQPDFQIYIRLWPPAYIVGTR